MTAQVGFGCIRKHFCGRSAFKDCIFAPNNNLCVFGFVLKQHFWCFIYFIFFSNTIDCSAFIVIINSCYYSSLYLQRWIVGALELVPIRWAVHLHVHYLHLHAHLHLGHLSLCETLYMKYIDVVILPCSAYQHSDYCFTGTDFLS